MKEMTEMYDVLLISPWSEPVNVLPSFHIIRQKVEKYSNILAKQKVPEFFSKNKNQDECGNVIRYFEKFPVSVGLLCIAAVLERKGYKVRYMSLDYDKYKANNASGWLEEAVKSAVENTRYAIGVTSVTPEFNRAIQILELSRKYNPGLLKIIGGPHVTYLDEEAIAEDAVDVVIRGEGEETFLELLENWISKKDFSGVDGITYKNNGSTIRNADRKSINLGEFPGPAFHLLPKEDIDKFILYTYFGRGCANNCAYCVEGMYWGNKLRYRPIKEFVDELQFFAEEFNWKFIHIIDSDFLQAKQQIPDLCDELERRGLNIILSINVSPKLHRQASPDLLQRMVNVGFKEFLIGSESADEQLLANMNRKQTFEELQKSIEILNEVGVPFISTYWVVGFPGETRETIQKTIEGLTELFEKDLIYHGSTKLFIPYPGTRIYNHPEEYGLKIFTKQWERFDRYGFPPPYIHSNLTPFELQHYIMLLQSIQLKYFIKRTDSAEEHMKELCVECDASYLKKIYM